MSDMAGSPYPLTWRDAWRHPWTWGLTAISLGLLAWILVRASPVETWNSLRSADRGFIIIGIPIIVANLVFRATRWRILLIAIGKARFWDSFTSMAVGYLGNNLLPARAGEVMRAYLLGRDARISKSAVLGTIVVERVIDTLGLLLVLSVLLIAVPMPGWVRSVVITGGAASVGIILTFVAFQKYRFAVIKIAGSLFTRLPPRWHIKGLSLFEDFLSGVASFHKCTDVVAYSLMTILIWSTDILLFWLYLRAFGISLAIVSVVLVVATAALSTAIPSLPGYVGTYQFVIVNTLLVLGASVNPATAFALGLHGVTWVTVNLVGAACAMQQGVDLKQPLKRRLERGSSV